MRRISIAIPSFNRYQQTIDSFAQVLKDDRVAEVVLVDDASTDESYEKLVEYVWRNDFGQGKIYLSRNRDNLDCYANKHEAASKAKNDWCVIFDSDNTLTPSYLDAIYAIPEWDKKTIYMPEFARPFFSAKEWSGLTITKENVAQYVNTNLMTNLNAMNFFINRDEYLRVWDGSVDPGSSDSIYFSTCWLEAGNKILVTPNLQYDHYISPKKDGHYETNSHKFVEFHKNLMERISKLK